jgi:hypothetical protein
MGDLVQFPGPKARPGPVTVESVVAMDGPACVACPELATCREACEPMIEWDRRRAQSADRPFPPVVRLPRRRALRTAESVAGRVERLIDDALRLREAARPRGGPPARGPR